MNDLFESAALGRCVRGCQLRRVPVHAPALLPRPTADRSAAGHRPVQRLCEQCQHPHPHTHHPMACLLVFLAWFRRQIRQARPDDEWVDTLVFGARLVVITLEPVGDALQSGAALDTSIKADPSVVRGLMESSFVFYGAIGLMMSALLLASAGYATLATSVLPRWTGWVAYSSAVVNLVAAPSIFGGPTTPVSTLLPDG
jgi:hypothetical protein